MLKYLKAHILEELDGAVDYMQKAVEKKGHQCGETFRQMSGMELDHANALLKMFRQQEKPKTIADADYAEMQKAVLDAYTDKMTEIEALRKMYWAV